MRPLCRFNSVQPGNIIRGFILRNDLFYFEISDRFFVAMCDLLLRPTYIVYIIQIIFILQIYKKKITIITNKGRIL